MEQNCGLGSVFGKLVCPWLPEQSQQWVTLPSRGCCGEDDTGHGRDLPEAGQDSAEATSIGEEISAVAAHFLGGVCAYFRLQESVLLNSPLPGRCPESLV